MDEVLVGQRAVPKALLDLSEDDYQLYLKDDRWRVYDARIEGVSFVSTYRTDFSSALTIRVASRHVAPAHKPDPRCDGTPTLMPFTADGLLQPVASKPVPDSECRTRCPIAASSLRS